MFCGSKDFRRVVAARWFTRWLAAGLPVALIFVGALTSTSHAQTDKFKDLFEGALTPKAVAKATFTATLAPADAKPGDEVTLKVMAQLPENSHIYATTGEFDGRTKIKIVAADQLEPIDSEFHPDRAPKVALEPAFNQEVETFHGDVSWTTRFHLKPDADVSKATVDLELEGLYCTDGPGGSCTPVKTELHAALADASVPFEFKARPGLKTKPVEVQFQLAPTKSSGGKIVKLLVTMVVDKDWHTFSTTFEGEGGQPTEFTLNKIYGLKAVGDGFVASRPPEIESVPEVNPRQEVYHDKVTWIQEFEVLPDARPFGYGVEGSVKFQTCKKSCITLNQVFKLGVTSDDVKPPSQLAFLPEIQIETGTTHKPQDKGFLFFIFTAVVAGLVALLTPCVFPMVPITVSFFLKQNESKGTRPVLLAIVFCAAIVASFVVIGVGIAAIFGATKPNELANNWILNLFLATIFFTFALNMLGLFEIQVPSWMLSMSSSGERAGGYVGVIFMALTFVLTSFSCTFAFVGSLLAAAAKGDYYWPVLGMLAFGATFAAPFFVLALTPGFLKSLPKSGGWLNSVKVVMGFVEAGVAVKYISIVDQQWNSVPWLFDFTNVMTLWAVLSVCTGLYLLGQFRLSHDSPVQGLSPVRVLLAMGFLMLGGLFVVGLTHPDRDAWLVDQLVAFAPAQLNDGEFGIDLDVAIEDAKRTNKPLFIDFTGVFCTNCRLMEKRMAKPHNRRRLERCVLVQLYTDKVPKITDKAEADRILKQNVNLQVGWYGDVTLPAYAVVTPDGKQLLASYLGLEPRTGDFAKFLDEGWEKWQTLQGRTVTRMDAEPIR